ncbi:MAG: amino acid ABC transporter permease [Thermoanaerobaculia bacterium]
MNLIAVNFDWGLFVGRLIHPDATFLRALETTVVIAVSAQAIGVLLGLATALARLSRLLPLRALAILYTLVIRGTPVIVQIFFVYYGVNIFLGIDLFPQTVNFFYAFTVSGAVVAGIAALAVNEGAYMAEIIRSGIESVGVGQSEAAKSLGMHSSLSMRRVILPQAARVILPPLGNQFITMLKVTSLLFFIGVYEMFADAQVHYANTFKPSEYFGAVAIWYLLITGVWSLIQYAIERRLSVSTRPERPTRRLRVPLRRSQLLTEDDRR